MMFSPSQARRGAAFTHRRAGCGPEVSSIPLIQARSETVLLEGYQQICRAVSRAENCLSASLTSNEVTGCPRQHRNTFVSLIRLCYAPAVPSEPPKTSQPASPFGCRFILCPGMQPRSPAGSGSDGGNSRPRQAGSDT